MRTEAEPTRNRTDEPIPIPSHNIQTVYYLNIIMHCFSCHDKEPSSFSINLVLV
uniref:Uncharacterized protein n=1 Tax=Rhizophagus irregularis (strain DAOM 181602 / DAOM 197198 / MUCL 43194) TaxID=747089 RepID=U9US61_RHIID